MSWWKPDCSEFNEFQSRNICEMYRDVSIDMNLVDLKVWSDLSISNDFRIAPDVASWFDSKQLRVQPATLPTCWWCWFCLEVNSWSLPPRCWILWSVFHDRTRAEATDVSWLQSFWKFSKRLRAQLPERNDVSCRGLERGSRWHRCGDAFRWNRQPANSRSKQLPPCVTFAKWEKGQWTTRPGTVVCWSILVFASIQPRTLWLDTVTHCAYLDIAGLVFEDQSCNVGSQLHEPSLSLSDISMNNDPTWRFQIFSPIFNSLRSSPFVPLRWRQSLMQIALLLHYSCRVAFRWNALSINNSSIEKIRNVK